MSQWLLRYALRIARGEDRPIHAARQLGTVLLTACGRRLGHAEHVLHRPSALITCARCQRAFLQPRAPIVVPLRSTKR